MRCVFFGIDHILTYSDRTDLDLHRHWAKHVVIGLEGKVNVAAGGERLECDGIMIDSNVWHTISGDDRRHLVISYEDASEIARKMEEKYFFGSDIHLLPPAIVERIRQEFRRHEPGGSSEKCLCFHDAVLASLGLERGSGSARDGRIDEVLEFIRGKNELDGGIMREILDLVHVSQSRFSHLFKEQVGIPFNSYLLMMKLKKGIYVCLAGLERYGCLHFLRLSQFLAFCGDE